MFDKRLNDFRNKLDKAIGNKDIDTVEDIMKEVIKNDRIKTTRRIKRINQM